MTLHLNKFGLSLLFISCFAQALPEDSQKEIHITSDKASIDRQQGLVIYTGNVELSQGTLYINADKITLIQTKTGLEKVIAEGKPAKYQQILNANEEKTKAYGDTIIYKANNEELTLLNNAGLEKKGNTFTGKKIVYFIKEQRVKADSSTTTSSPEERIKVVIQPQQIEEKK